MNPDELHDGLVATAELAGPPRIDLERVVGSVRRRRFVRMATVSGVGLTVAAVVALAITANGGPFRQVTNAAAPSPNASSANNPKGVRAGQVRTYTCGESVADPIVPGSTHGGVTVAIAGVQRGAGGAPEVRYSLASTRALSIDARIPGRPRVLVLKDGRIVAGQDAPPGGTSHPPVSDKVGHFTTLDPAHPFTSTLAAPQGMPCDRLSWNALWGRGYQVALVVSAQDFDIPAATSGAAHGQLGLDPVVIVSHPLS